MSLKVSQIILSLVTEKKMSEDSQMIQFNGKDSPPPTPETHTLLCVMQTRTLLRSCFHLKTSRYTDTTFPLRS